MQNLLDVVQQFTTWCGMEINVKKTFLLVIGKDRKRRESTPAPDLDKWRTSQNARNQLRVPVHHTAYAIDFHDTDIDTFIAQRPDGLAFDKEKNLCIFLEYTRAMDTSEDWAEKKEQEKNDRYSSHLGFINHLSNREKSGWKASQTNFTTGVRDSLHSNQFLTRLESLWVNNQNTREAIRNRTVQKTLSMSDMILKFFFIAINSKTQWTLQNLPTEIVSKNMERFNLHLQSPRK